MWDTKPIPQCLFPALIVGLLKRHETPHFNLHHPSESEMQYHNAIHLTCIGTGGAILLVNVICWMEVYYSGPSTKCSIIKAVIFKQLKMLSRNFNISHFSQCLKNISFALYVHFQQIICAIEMKTRHYLLVVKTACQQNISIKYDNFPGLIKMQLL